MSESKVKTHNLRKPGLRKAGKNRRLMPVPRGPTLGMDIDTGAAAVGRIARRALAQVVALKSLLNVEDKVCDNAGSAVTISSASPTLYLLSAIAQGVGYTERTGLSVKATSQSFRATMTLDTASPGCVIRVILLLDRQAHGSAPTAGDVLQNSALINSPVNYVGSERFAFLYDKSFALSQNGNQKREFELNFPVKYHLTFGSATATDVDSTAAYLLLMSDVNANLPYISYVSRITYVDN